VQHQQQRQPRRNATSKQTKLTITMMSPMPDQNGDATPPENMSVSELRQWLKEFGNKQQEHFNQGQLPNDRRQTPTNAMASGGIIGQPKDKSNSQQPKYYRSGNIIAVKQRAVPTTMPNEPFESSQENQGLSQSNNMAFDAPSTRPKDQGGKKLVFLSYKVVGSDKRAYKPEVEIGIIESKSSYFSSDEGPILESKSSDLPEAPDLKQDGEISLALSAVPFMDSSSSIPQLPLVRSVDEETFDMDNTKNNPFSPDSKNGVEKPVRKAVPADWSDLEPVDFDASNEGSSGSGNEDEDDPFVSPSVTWPIWSKSGAGNAREYLKKQTLAPFQGYWSDTECDDDDEDDDAVHSVATDYQKRNSKSARARRARERHSRGLLPLETPFEGSPTNFTLADAARESRGVPHPRSNPNSLSDHFLMHATAKAPKECHPNQTMHNAKLFQNTMITAGALDLICHDRAKPRSSPIRQNATSSSCSEGSGGPSVAPNAVDAKLAKVFSNEMDKAGSVSSTPEKRQPRQSRTLDKSDDKRQGAPVPPFSPGKMRIQEWVDAAEKIEQQQQKQTQLNPTIAPTTKTFSSAIEKFGGRGKKARQKTKVELRKEALEAQWAINREAKLVETKKTKWEVSRTPGTYKKKIVLAEK
jgi:hypothetical protein